MVGSVQQRAAEMRFRDLGPLVISSGGVDRLPGGSRPAAALALLLMNVNRRVSADALREAMWGDETHRHVSSTLDTHLFRLRKVLEPGRLAGEPPSVLISDAGGFRLVVPPDHVDSVRFTGLVAETEDLLRTGQPTRALRKSEEALSLRRGRPFEPVTDETWATAAVTRIEEAYAQLMEGHIEALLACGEPGKALQELGPILAEHPLRERLWAQRMEAACRAGRVGDALQAFHDARERLINELGVEPGPELQTLQTRILAGDQSLFRHNAEPVIDVQRDAQLVVARLPRRAGELFGRTDELNRIRQLCITKSVLTITGAGGCGKTRLAIEAAQRLGEEFLDGIWFVDLAAVQENEQVADAVTSELGLAPTNGGSRLDMLRMFVRDRRMLLILDNCEHVLDGVAELIEEIMVPDAEFLVLATSREPIQVANEYVFSIQPLQLPEVHHPGDADSGEDVAHPEETSAVQLFLDRANIAVPVGPGRAELLGKVTAICRAVDGVPLAIELAAARARAYSVDEILRQVSSDPAALHYRRRGVPEHQQSVQLAVEWSHRMLTAAERLVHRRVSVVPGAFTTDTVAQLSELERSDAQDVLVSLVHKSMIAPIGPGRTDGPSRFVQLATIRAHARHELSANHEAEKTEKLRDQRVADLVIAKPRLGHQDERSWMHKLDDDSASLRITLHDTLRRQSDPRGVAIARRLAMYWFYRGLIPEAERWYTLAMNVSDASPVDRAGVIFGLAGVRALAQRMDQARPLIDQGIQIAGRRARDDDVSYGEFLLQLGGAVLLAGDYPTSTALAHRSMKIGQESGDELLVLISQARLTSDPRSEAADSAPEIYRDAVALDNHYAAFIAANTAALRAIVVGDPETGLIWSGRAIELNVRHDIGQAQGMLEVRANLLAMTAQPEEALKLYSAARFHNARAGLSWPSRDVTATLLEQAITQVTRSQYERAWRLGRRLTLFDLSPADLAPAPHAA